ncbi:hypothetical protein SELMODRAFT_60277, partial [Selaginella moellendorffii]
FIAILVTGLWISTSSGASVNPLLDFRSGLTNSQALGDWIIGSSPCGAKKWTGISCASTGAIVAISLSGLELQGPISAATALLGLPALEELDLSSNALSGEIPPQLWQLPKIKRLDLSHNLLQGASFDRLFGYIPPSIFSLAALRQLDLSSNLLFGTIPASNLSRSLQILDLANNSLTGEIPPSIGDLSNLTELSLGLNSALLGSIPPSIGKLSKLEILYAANCKLAGPIPHSLPPSLRKLDLSNNPLQSPIPDSIGDLSRIQSISIASAQLNGSIPGSLGRCSSLELLNLAFNQLSGPLPDDLAALEKIITFSVVGNSLSGPIPRWIGQWQLADSILLSTNSFSGSIPPELGQCRAVTDLGLDNNQLTGSIPPELCDAGLLSQLTLDHNTLTGSLAGGTLRRCGNLTQLDVTGNRLTGEIPRYFSDLPKLVILDISTNFFMGSIPDELWHATQLMEIYASDNLLEGGLSPLVGRMENLQHLYLDRNRLSGPLPSELGLLKSLTVLSLAGNAFDGVIPREIFGGTTGLTTLDLGGNRLGGAIPPEIGKLVGLDCLVLSHNRLSGQIPAEVASLFQIAVPPESGFVQHHGVLDLSHNSLTGPIPSGIGQCSVLVELDLSNNLLQGRIPPEISLLANLTTLDLSSNMLQGRIPWQLGENSKLQGLNLGFNRLTGQIPPELGNLERLVKLNISGNALTGSIPDHLGQLSGLSHLDASGNGLTGSLPDSFSGLVSIVGFKNSLTGEIPSEIGGILQLSYLDLSVNKLVGGIPGSLCELTELGFFNVSDNGLTGDIPQEGICKNFSRLSYGGNRGLCGLAVGVSCGALDDLRGNGGQPVLLKPGAIWAITMASTVAFFCIVFAAIRWRMMRQQSEALLGEKIKLNSGNHNSHGSTSSSSPFSNTDVSQEPLSINVAMFERPLLKLTLSDIVTATNGFSKANVIGDGGYGTVYRAVLPDGRTVAVKKLAPVRDYRAVRSGSSCREFLAEMETLGKVKHRNLVTLLGYCSYGEERLLVYDYMVNGSLDVWLRNRTDALEALTWDRRLRIAVGAARGLAFLHHGIVPHVIHRDVKASNILLDADFEPRVADFGLARLISAYDTHVSTDIAGTFGYIPPEYGMTWRATSKGDVYSYGVILLELVTGKEPTGPDFKDTEIGNLVGWVRSMVRQGKSDEVLDVAVATRATWRSCMHQVLHIAMVCTADEPMKRPPMMEVVRQLKEL